MSDQEFKAEYNFSMSDNLSSAGLAARNVVGNEEFYAELNRVLGNLKLIRQAQPSCGVLVSYVKNADGDSIKIVLN
jgi:hypothetical protein